jgi:signal transduction histidine kinase
MLRSLRAKLVLTYTGLTLLTVGALALFTISSLEDLLLRRLAGDLGAQAGLVADQIADDLAAGRLDAVRDRLARVDAITAARALAIDSRRRIVGASEVSDRPLLGTAREEEGVREALRGEPTSKILPRTPGGEVLYAATPIWHDGQIVGAVRLAYRLQDVEGTLRNLNATVALGALGAVLLAALISLSFARAIGNPIRELSRAAHALAAGDLHQRLEPTSNDEVGELVRSFNTMASKLREAEVARKEFASDVSHELYSLAGTMQTAAQALERGAGRDEILRERLIGGLVGHTHRLSRLAEDLLQLARLQEGRLALDLQPCSLADLARRTVDEFAAEAEQHGLDLTVQTGDELPLEGDRVRLVQALGNLVENAVKYTPPGGRVVVAAAAVDGEYLLSVADNGGGIPPDELPHIWDRYYRVEGRASGGPAGTGLGLAIAAGIVKAHGGRIDVESHLDQGTRFTIHLPRPHGS